MPYIKVGYCNHCGDCCKPPIMLENPCIKRGSDRCDFYTDTENSYLYGHCLFYARGNKPITQVKDRNGNKATEAQINWYLQNCIDFPKAEDAGKFTLPSGCGFSFEVVG